MEEREKVNETELRVLDLLKEIIDPELGINIVDLGLVYEISFTKEKGIRVVMTLSSKGCPMGNVIINMVESALENHYPDHTRVVELTWEPVWTTDRISEEGMMELNMR